MQSFGGYYAGKTLLVTGVAGVKGPWLAAHLLEAGATVVGLDIRAPRPEDNLVASGVLDRIRFVQADVNDVDQLATLLREVDGVVHLAAVSLVAEARRDPFETYRSNTMGTVAVLEALRRTPSVRDAVLVTTDKVYRPNGGKPWVETDPLFASEPYPVSKACAEAAIADYVAMYLGPAGQRIGIARAGNVLLGGDPYSSERVPGAGHLHVDCYEALLAGRPPELFSPEFTRPYTYGLDVLAGYLTLMARLGEPEVSGQAFNFGPLEPIGLANGAVATMICQSWGTDMKWRRVSPRPEPFERQSLNWDRAAQRLGWRPAYGIGETVNDLTTWYKVWGDRRRRAMAGVMSDVHQQLLERHRTAAARQGLWWAS